MKKLFVISLMALASLAITDLSRADDSWKELIEQRALSASPADLRSREASENTAPI